MGTEFRLKREDLRVDSTTLNQRCITRPNGNAKNAGLRTSRAATTAGKANKTKEAKEAKQEEAKRRRSGADKAVAVQYFSFVSTLDVWHFMAFTSAQHHQLDAAKRKKNVQGSRRCRTASRERGEHPAKRYLRHRRNIRPAVCFHLKHRWHCLRASLTSLHVSSS